MKMTKSELKSIVKECLIEILNEGMGGAVNTQKMSGPADQKTVMRQPTSSQMFVESSTPRKTTPALREAIKDAAGGNKIMESIFADTAAKTLPNMLNNDRPGPVVGGGIAERVVSQTNPEQLFGEEAAAKWAELAFMGSSKQ